MQILNEAKIREREKELFKKRDELRKQNVEVYSISKLNTFNNCKYEYITQYGGYKCEECGTVYGTHRVCPCSDIETIKQSGNRGKGNIYSVAGTAIHDIMEEIHDNTELEITEQDIQKFMNMVNTNIFLNGMQFPKNAEDNWKYDIEHFLRHFEPLEYNNITELYFLTQIEGHWVQGYIDIILEIDGEILVYDWKTSSRFTGENIVKNGRQLMLYVKALEQAYGIKADATGWYMLRLVEVNHGGYSRISNRYRWVQDLKNPIKNQLKKYGADPMLIEDAIKENSLDIEGIPEKVRDRYVLKDAIIEHDPHKCNVKSIQQKIETEGYSLITETEEYVRDTVSAIEKETKWDALDIRRNGDFFCNTLCNFKDDCPYIKEHNQKQLSNKMKDREDMFRFFR